MSSESSFPLHRSERAKTHRVTYRLAPLTRIATCTCGWSAVVLRHNSRGPARLRAIARRHLEDQPHE